LGKEKDMDEAFQKALEAQQDAIAKGKSLSEAAKAMERELQKYSDEEAKPGDTIEGEIE
jgi:hypothetical protein